MKKIMVFLIVVVLLCTQVSVFAQNEKLHLGAVMIDFTNQFFVDMMEAGNVAAEDYNVDISWKSADGNIDTQIALMENFIEQGVDCILVNPIDNDALITVVQEAADAGIPVVVMAGLVDHPFAVNTLYNDYEDTKLIAKIGAKLIGEKGKVALLYGNKGNVVSDLRQAGYVDAMKEFPEITLIEQPTDWNPATGQQVTQDILAANPDLSLLHCVSDSVTIAALQSVIAAGKQDQVRITSYDGNEAACKLVESGEFYLDLLTGSKRVGYWNVKIGAKLAAGEKAPSSILYLPSHFVMTDEVAAQVKEWGLAEGISILSPQEAIEMADNYQADLGPTSTTEW